jgi:hypothetical protein
MSWERLPAIGPVYSGCASALPKPGILRMHNRMVSDGSVWVTRDNELVWSGGDDEEIRVRDFEKIIAADPDHDWRIEFCGGLSQVQYQRQGVRRWVAVKKGPGYA